MRSGYGSGRGMSVCEPNNACEGQHHYRKWNPTRPSLSITQLDRVYSTAGQWSYVHNAVANCALLLCSNRSGWARSHPLAAGEFV